MLYRSTDHLCRRAAPVQYLSHSEDATAMFGDVLEKEVFDKTGMVDLVDTTAEGFEVDKVAELLSSLRHTGSGHTAKEAAGYQTGQEPRAGWIGF
jgi:uncharacterized protein CbrC (UPF0167 family)